MSLRPVAAIVLSLLLGCSGNAPAPAPIVKKEERKVWTGPALVLDARPETLREVLSVEIHEKDGHIDTRYTILEDMHEHVNSTHLTDEELASLKKGGGLWVKTNQGDKVVDYRLLDRMSRMYYFSHDLERKKHLIMVGVARKAKQLLIRYEDVAGQDVLLEKGLTEEQMALFEAGGTVVLGTGTIVVKELRPTLAEERVSLLLLKRLKE